MLYAAPPLFFLAAPNTSAFTSMRTSYFFSSCSIWSHLCKSLCILSCLKLLCDTCFFSTCSSRTRRSATAKSLSKRSASKRLVISQIIPTCNEMSGNRVWVIDVCLISVFHEAAYTGLQASNFNLFTVFLRCLNQSVKLRVTLSSLVLGAILLNWTEPVVEGAAACCCWEEAVFIF